MLPTSKEFERFTSPNGDGQKRGSTLIGIDSALNNWHLQSSSSAQSQMQALYALMKECRHYLRKHALGGHRHFRSQVVKSLLEEAQSELKRVAPTVGRALTFLELQKRRKREKLGSKPLTKSLKQGFHHERTLWLRDNKQQMPMSGSYVYQVARNPPDHITDEYLDSEEGLNTFVKFHESSLEQYEKMGTLSGARFVGYHNKISRLQFLAMPDGKGGFTDISERSIHMDRYDHRGDAVRHMYALDHNGNLLTREAPEDQDGQYFNHSSFNAGRDVMCAGEILIRDGTLRYLDNNSGHYAPTTDHLLSSLRFLHEEGIDLSRTIIKFYGQSGLFEALPLLEGVWAECSEEMTFKNELRRRIWQRGTTLVRDESLDVSLPKARVGTIKMGSR